MELEARGLVVELRPPGGASVRALDRVDLALQRGEMVALMGPPGAGKSTLAMCLASLLTPTAGQVMGEAAGAVRMVLQRPESTFLRERVLDEVALGSTWQGAAAAVAERRARELISELGLDEGVLQRDPLALSGGEQRRVAIAAVLATEPRVLVLDEPSAGLDAGAREELHAALGSLHAAGRTIVLVTHDPAEAARLASRVVVLRDGRVAWDGPAADLLGSPQLAAEHGVEVAAEVRILHEVASSRGLRVPPGVATAQAATAALTALVREPLRGEPAPVHTTAAAAAAAPAGGRARGRPLALPAAIDARARLAATSFAVAASLLAQSLVAAAVVTAAAAGAVVAGRVERRQVASALRPLVMLGLMLVLLQAALGGDVKVELRAGSEVASGALAALFRLLQLTGVVLATLALTATTPAVDLAAALRWLLAPLRLLRVPVDALALVTATALGLLPALADELDRLRLAQAARGIAPRSGSPLARARTESMLLVPLFVIAFRRAHLLAEALAVRGYRPGAARTQWRPRRVPASDLLLAGSGIVLVAAARLL